MLTKPLLFPLMDHETSILTHNTVCQMAHQMRRRSSIDRASVQAILTSGDSGLPSPVPSTRLGSSPSKFDMPPPAQPPIARHTRTLSYTPRNSNRLSLNFPIATANGSDDGIKATPTTSNTYSFPPTPVDIMPSPSDPSGLLAAMAGQERKVFEIREELQKAERELLQLRRQWANHENKRKHAAGRQIEQLQPLQTVVTDGGRSSEEGKRQSMEIERRKSLILSHSKQSRRKKFSGTHTRALSLLSPERSNFTQPFPTVTESHADAMGLPIPRSTTMPDTSQGLSKVSSDRARHSYQGGVTHNAKQIAEDLKSGLWTFMEDLRQATIGDEALGSPPNRLGLDLAHSGPKKKESRGSLRGSKNRHSSPGGTVLPRTWDSLTGANIGLGMSDAGGQLRPPSRTSSKSPVGTLRKKKSKHLSFAPVNVDDMDDDWSNWDSPAPSIPKSPRWSGSTDLSDPATPSNGSSEERSVKIHGEEPGTPSRRDEIQWPALDTFTPTNLKRTMSTLMQEWDKALTPPITECEDPLLRSSPDSGSEQERHISQMPLM